MYRSIRADRLHHSWGQSLRVVVLVAAFCWTWRDDAGVDVYASGGSNMLAAVRFARQLQRGQRFERDFASIEVPHLFGDVAQSLGPVAWMRAVDGVGIQPA